MGHGLEDWKLEVRKQDKRTVKKRTKAYLEVMEFQREMRRCI